MAKTRITIRVDSELKQSAEALFEDLGLNISVAITMFLKSAVSHNGIPFEIRRFAPDAETRAALAEFGEMKNNPGAYKRYDSFDDLMTEILSNA